MLSFLPRIKVRGKLQQESIFRPFWIPTFEGMTDGVNLIRELQFARPLLVEMVCLGGGEGLTEKFSQRVIVSDHSLFPSV
jgi:hypothetical protein